MKLIKLLITSVIMILSLSVFGQTLTATDSRGIAVQIDINTIFYSIKSVSPSGSILIIADKSETFFTSSNHYSIQILGCNKFYSFTLAKRSGSLAVGDSILLNVKYAQVQQSTSGTAVLTTTLKGITYYAQQSYGSIIAQTSGNCSTSATVVVDNATIKSSAGVLSVDTVATKGTPSSKLATGFDVQKATEITPLTSNPLTSVVAAMKVGDKIELASTDSATYTKIKNAYLKTDYIKAARFPAQFETVNAVIYDYSNAKLNNGGLIFDFDTKVSKWVLKEGQYIAKASFPSLSATNILVTSIIDNSDSSVWVVKKISGGTTAYVRQTLIDSISTPTISFQIAGNTFYQGEATWMRRMFTKGKKMPFVTNDIQWIPRNGRINIQEAGCVSDFVESTMTGTDNYALMQEIADTISKNGWEFFIPVGTFGTSKKVIFSNGNNYTYSIIGGNKVSSIIRPLRATWNNLTDDALFEVRGNTITVKDIFLNAKDNNNTIKGVSGLKVNIEYEITINNAQFSSSTYDYGNTGVVRECAGLWIYKTKHTALTECSFANSYSYAMMFYNPIDAYSSLEDFKISQCHFVENSSAIIVKSYIGYLTMSQCNISGSGLYNSNEPSIGYGLGVVGGYIGSLTLDNNDFQFNGVHFYDRDGNALDKNTIITANRFASSRKWGLVLNTDNNSVYGKYIISNNIFINNGTDHVANTNISTYTKATKLTGAYQSDILVVESYALKLDISNNKFFTSDNLPKNKHQICVNPNSGISHSTWSDIVIRNNEIMQYMVETDTLASNEDYVLKSIVNLRYKKNIYAQNKQIKPFSFTTEANHTFGCESGNNIYADYQLTANRSWSIDTIGYVLGEEVTINIRNLNGFYAVLNNQHLDLYNTLVLKKDPVDNVSKWYLKEQFNQTIQQTSTSSSIAIGNNTTDLIINPASANASQAIGVPTISKKIGDIVRIRFGGTIVAGTTVVTGATTFSGGTTYGDVIPNGVKGGDEIQLYYDGSAWKIKYLPYYVASYSSALISSANIIATASQTAFTFVVSGIDATTVNTTRFEVYRNGILAQAGAGNDYTIGTVTSTNIPITWIGAANAGSEKYYLKIR